MCCWGFSLRLWGAFSVARSLFSWTTLFVVDKWGVGELPGWYWHWALVAVPLCPLETFRALAWEWTREFMVGGRRIMASFISLSSVGQIVTADNIKTNFCKQIHEGYFLVSQMFIILFFPWNTYWLNTDCVCLKVCCAPPQTLISVPLP
jgi:hypothetical protein